MPIENYNKKLIREDVDTGVAKPTASYQPSDSVKQAQRALQTQLISKPGAYQSQWQKQLNDTMGKILNREKFSYDLNGDALYQQYKDKFTTQGKMAMMDTMGQAQVMTGGYGNSYAQMAGQQAYQGQLQNLNDKIPELYQLAMDTYNQKGQDLYNQYSLLSAQEGQEYSRHRDSVNDWNAQLERLQNQYYTERNFDYGQFADNRAFDYQASRDAVADSQWQQSFDYQQGRDKIADSQWQQSFDYQQGRDKIADTQWQQQFDESQRQWNESFNYQQSRDQIADNQWQQQFDYQQGRDKISDSQWQQSFDESIRQYDQNLAYQQDRDKIADSQWQKQFDEAMRQYDQNYQYQQGRDQIADQQWNQSFQYQKDRDAVADQQWNQNFQYQQGRDQVADQQWDQSFQYQKDRDSVSDKQWDQSFQYQQGRDKVSDEQWQKEFDEAIRQFNFINKIGEFAVVGGSEPSTPSNPSSKKNNNNNNAANMNTLLNNIANKGALTGNDTATKNMMNKEIDAAQKAGAITQQEANHLKNQYGVNKPAAKPTGPAKRLPK